MLKTAQDSSNVTGLTMRVSSPDTGDFKMRFQDIQMLRTFVMKTVHSILTVTLILGDVPHILPA